MATSKEQPNYKWHICCNVCHCQRGLRGQCTKEGIKPKTLQTVYSYKLWLIAVVSLQKHKKILFANLSPCVCLCVANNLHISSCCPGVFGLAEYHLSPFTKCKPMSRKKSMLLKLKAMWSAGLRWCRLATERAEKSDGAKFQPVVDLLLGGQIRSQKSTVHAGVARTNSF